MQLADVRYLFGYDRWATRRILALIDGLDEGRGVRRASSGIAGSGRSSSTSWARTSDGGTVSARRAPATSGETEAAASPRRRRATWADSWDALDAWLDTLTDEWLQDGDDGVPFWQMLAHVANHGTQHRSEAAAILTEAGRSPGDLDMILFAGELAHGSRPIRQRIGPTPLRNRAVGPYGSPHQPPVGVETRRAAR